MIKIEVINEIVWERLQVFKIIKYNYKQKAFKPFAQARLCYKINEGLLIKMWAFEVSPLNNITEDNDINIFNDSVLSLVLGNVNDEFITMTFNKNGKHIIQKYKNNYNVIIKEDLSVNCFKGEDLQGIYWGINFLISNFFLEKYLKIKINNYDKFYINFVKSCNDKKYFHCGGFVEIKDNWYENLEEAVILKNNI